MISPEISPSLMDTNSSKYSSQIVGIDKKMYNLHKKLNFTALLRPQNYQSELEKFLQNPYQYNPIFEYKYPDKNQQNELEMLMEDVETEIRAIPSSDGVFQKIFSEKLSEFRDRLALIVAYRDSDYERISEANFRLFGAFSPKLLDEATKKVLENARTSREAMNKIL